MDSARERRRAAGPDPRAGPAVPRRRLPDPRPFVPGTTPLPCAGRVFDDEDLVHLVDCLARLLADDGPLRRAVRARLCAPFGVRHAMLVNSGSSANLLALSALPRRSSATRRSRPGDEVITVAAGFPTTVNPIIQNGLVPVFVDVDLPTYNIDVSAARSRPLRPDPRDHARPHAGQPVRPRGRHRRSPGGTTSG